jgi:hypothetical protein
MSSTGTVEASVPAIGQRALVIAAETAGEDELGLVAVHDPRQAVAGDEDEVQDGCGEPQARLDATAPEELG